MKLKEILEESEKYSIIDIKSLAIDDYAADLEDMETGELEEELEKVEASFTRALKDSDYKDVKKKAEAMKKLLTKAIKAAEEPEEDESDEAKPETTQTPEPVVGGNDAVQVEPETVETSVTEPTPAEDQELTLSV